MTEMQVWRAKCPRCGRVVYLTKKSEDEDDPCPVCSSPLVDVELVDRDY